MFHVTAEDYEALSEEICRQIEIVDGTAVLRPSPSRPHQDVVLSLTTALDSACSSELAAVHQVDLRLRDVPLLNRQPDVVVYDASLPNEEVLRPQHCRLVVEIMSPVSVSTDQLDKPAEYAAAGITHFWRVESDDQSVSVFRYRLDPTTRTYTPAGVDTGKLVVSDPFELTIDLDALLH